MTAAPTLPIQTGTVESSPIVAQVNSASLASLVRVTLSADYARSPAPGYPVPNAGSATPSAYASAQTIHAGATVSLFSDEAAALVAAGAAAYA